MGGAASGGLALDYSGKGVTQLEEDALAIADKITDLDLSHNSIKTLPTKMPRLRRLSLAHNGISEFDQAMFDSLTGLSQLSVAGNEIAQYNDLFRGIASLKRLDLSRNGMSAVVMLNESVEELDVSRNFLSEFPCHITPGLKILNLDFNRICYMNVSMANLASLTISMNGLVSVEPNVRFPSLRYLVLSKNDILQLPNMKIVTPKLEYLDVSENLLEELPCLPETLVGLKACRNNIARVVDLAKQTPRLQDLDVSFNQIVDLGALPKSLRKLNATENQIKGFKEMSLPRLSKLVLNRNKLTEPPRFYASHLRNVQLSNNQISSLEQFQWSSDLCDFRASGNAIREIPAELIKIGALHNLELAQNQIQQVPRSITKSSIETLNLSLNPLHELPAMPSTLKSLYVMECGLVEIPDALSKSKSLTELVASNNELTDVPMIPSLEVLRLSRNRLALFPQVGQKIKVIDVSHNKITGFRKGFSCPDMVDLDVSYNLIKKLPSQLLDCKQLKSLDFSFNLIGGQAVFTPFEQLERIASVGMYVSLMPSPATKMTLIGTEEKPIHEYDSVVLNQIAVRDAVAFSEMTGKRPAMEDMFVIKDRGEISTFAVFDGHSGNASSIYGSYEYSQIFKNSGEITRGFMESAIRTITEKLRERKLCDGSTAAICMVSQTKIITAHIGDSRVLLIEDDGKVVFSTKDHKAVDRGELHKVMSVGGTITDMRVDGKLAITRSLSDFNINGVIRDPDVSKRVIDPKDKWLVLACDGVFDVLTSEMIGEMSLKAESAAHFAADIRNTAYALGSTDNITVVAVNLQQLIAAKSATETAACSVEAPSCSSSSC